MHRAALLSIMLLPACSRPDQAALLDGMGPHRPAGSKIYGGAAPDAPEHDAVVALHYVTRAGRVAKQPFCSGTLVTTDVVATAAHCLDDASYWASTFKEMDPSSLAIYVGDDPSVDLSSHTHLVSEVWIHPSFDRWALVYDLGLVRLDAPITESVTPVDPLPSAEGFTSADVGMTVNFAGFGATETGSYGAKMQVDGTIAGLGCAVSSCPDAGDTATQVSYSQAGGTGPCSGDSGGPMFVYRSSGTYLGGITSWGDSRCKKYGVSSRVDAFESEIAAFTASSSDTGADTGTPGPTCGDGTCDAGESCDGRGATTACSSDCAGRTTGPPRLRYCEVGSACVGRGCPP